MNRTAVFRPPEKMKHCLACLACGGRRRPPGSACPTTLGPKDLGLPGGCGTKRQGPVAMPFRGAQRPVRKQDPTGGSEAWGSSTELGHVVTRHPAAPPSFGPRRTVSLGVGDEQARPPPWGSQEPGAMGGLGPWEAWGHKRPGAIVGLVCDYLPLRSDAPADLGYRK